MPQTQRESFWTPTGPLMDAPRSILVVMLSAVGDAVMVLPVLQALRRTFPTVHIAWAIQEGPLELVRGHAAVDEVVVFRRRGASRHLHSSTTGARELGRTALALRERARAMPSGRFDLLLALQVYLKAGLLTAVTPAGIKLGFDRRRARDLNWLFTSHRIPPHPRGFGHVQDQYFEFLRHLGVDPEPLDYALRPTSEEMSAQRRFFGRLEGPVCAMVVSSSDPRKNWTPGGFARVAAGVRDEFGLLPVLVGGTSDLETAMARRILAEGGERILDARGGGLRRLLWLLDGSRVVVSPDTGPLHMARALEVPVVGLFGYTNPKRSGPYRLFQDLVVDGYARHPREAYGVSMQKRPGGMARIRPDAVMESIGLALDRYARRRKNGAAGT